MEETSRPAPSPRKPAYLDRKWWIENILSLALALGLVLLLRSSVVGAFKIPSGSMIPTLLVGDHIFVNEMAYGLKLPFSDWGAHAPVYLFHRSPPQRGDIIVFKYPRDESIYYIKRVIGVPGDTIEIRNKALFINRKEILRSLASKQESETLFKGIDEPKYNPANLDIYTEHLEGANHLIMLEKNNYLGENYGPVEVPAGQLFVMGDNRDFSNDSRFWGFVPLKDVKGKATLIWLSLWLNFSDNQYLFRPARSGTSPQ